MRCRCRAVRGDQLGMAGPQLLDRKVRAEHQPVAAEDVDRVVVRSVRSAPGRCGARRCRGRRVSRRDSGAWASVRRPPSMLRRSPARQVGQHAGMGQDEIRLRVLADELQPVLHLRGEKLQVEGQAVVLQPRARWRAPSGRSPGRATARSGRPASRASASCMRTPRSSGYFFSRSSCGLTSSTVMSA